MLGFEHEIIPTINEEEAYNNVQGYYQDKDMYPGLRAHNKTVYFDNEAQQSLEAQGLRIEYPSDTNRVVLPTERLYNPTDFAENTYRGKRTYENNVRGEYHQKKASDVMKPSIRRRSIAKF